MDEAEGLKTVTRCVPVILGLLLAFFASALAHAQGSRVAVVVGVGAYRNVPQLANPPRDARAMADVLRRLGFRTELVVDPDRPGLERAVRSLGASARSADVAMFFYAGHALEYNGKNYLVPIDANIQSGRDLPFETVDLDLMASQIEGASRTSLLFLDACRDNPFAMRLSGGERGLTSRGLAAPGSASTGTLVAFATAPGRTAADGDGGHSPFTRAILAQIETPGLEIRQLLSRVRRQVREETGGRQVPWESSALEGEFFFAPPRPAMATLPLPSLAPPALAPGPPAQALPSTAQSPPASILPRTPAPTAPPQLAFAPPPVPPESPRPPLPQAARPALDPNRRYACPRAGIVVTTSRGARIEYGGSETSDNVGCILTTDGQRRILYFGFVDPSSPTLVKTKEAIQGLLSGYQGQSIEYDDIRPTGYWHMTWTLMPDQNITIQGEARAAAHLVNLRAGRFGNNYQGRYELWIDRADGIVLKQTYESISGIPAGISDFTVTSIRRP